MSQNVLIINKRFRRKRALKRVFLFFLIFIFIFIGAFFSLFFIENLKTKKIIVEGNFVLSEQEIKKEIRKKMAAKVLGLIPKDRIFFLSAEGLRDHLFDKFSRLETVTVEKNWLELMASGLSSVLVKVEERQPFALLCEENNTNCFYIDQTAFIFARAPLFSDGVFIKFFDERREKPILGESLLVRHDFERLFVFKNRLADDFKLVEIHLRDGGICEFYLEDKPYLILSSGEKDWDTAQSNLSAFFKNTSAKSLKEIEYIDLRFGNKIFYK